MATFEELTGCEKVSKRIAFPSSGAVFLMLILYADVRTLVVVSTVELSCFKVGVLQPPPPSLSIGT